MTPKQLTKAREKLGLNKSELGKALDFSYEHVQRMEAGKKPIKLTTELAVIYLLSGDNIIIGDYRVSKAKKYNGDNCYYIEHKSGEAMGVDQEKLDNLIKEFFESEF